MLPQGEISFYDTNFQEESAKHEMYYDASYKITEYLYEDQEQNKKKDIKLK